MKLSATVNWSVPINLKGIHYIGGIALYFNRSILNFLRRRALLSRFERDVIP